MYTHSRVRPLAEVLVRSDLGGALTEFTVRDMRNTHLYRLSDTHFAFFDYHSGYTLSIHAVTNPDDVVFTTDALVRLLPAVEALRRAYPSQ